MTAAPTSLLHHWGRGQKSHMFGDSLFSSMKKTYLMQTVQWNMTAGHSLGAQALPSPEVQSLSAEGT